MGKGKAKGWRPPKTGEAASSMLFGSADHLTGDTIASPVQLREDANTLSRAWASLQGAEHSLFDGCFMLTRRDERSPKGPHWRGGRGGGSGRGKGGGKAGERDTRILPIVPKAAVSTKTTTQVEEAKVASKVDAAKVEVKIEKTEAAKSVAEAKVASQAVKEEIQKEIKKEETDEDGVFAKARDAANSLLASLGVKEEVPVVEEVKTEVEDENDAKARRMSEAKTEIERRREAMLQREKAAQQSLGVTTAEPEEDPEARRRAVEARRREAEATARQAEARRREALAANAARQREGEVARQEDTQQAMASSEQVKQELEHEQADDEQPIAKSSADSAAAPATEPASAQPMPEPKRPRVDSTSKAPGAAMQHGLQGWAARVNALAEGADDEPELVKRCRDFVRKRILKAHATGDLHAIAWDEEPVPSLEELMQD